MSAYLLLPFSYKNSVIYYKHKGQRFIIKFSFHLSSFDCVEPSVELATTPHFDYVSSPKRKTIWPSSTTALPSAMRVCNQDFCGWHTKAVVYFSIKLKLIYAFMCCYALTRGNKMLFGLKIFDYCLKTFEGTTCPYEDVRCLERWISETPNIVDVTAFVQSEPSCAQLYNITQELMLTRQFRIVEPLSVIP